MICTLIFLCWIATNQYLASRYVCDKKRGFYKWHGWLHAGYREFSAVYLFNCKLFICFNDYRVRFIPFVIEFPDKAITIFNVAFKLK